MADEKSEATSSAPAAASGGGNNKLLLIFTGVNLLVTVGIIGLLFVSFQKDAKKPSVTDIAAEADHGSAATGDHGGAAAGTGDHGATAGAAQKPAQFGKMISLEQFTVNLSTPGSTSPKYLKINISVEIPNADIENEVNLKMPQVRNVIIDLINSKRPADLATAEGRDYLKDEIKNALNTILVSGKVRGVFFTSFTLQS